MSKSSKPPDKSPADPVKVVPVEFVPDSDPVNIIVKVTDKSPADPVKVTDNSSDVPMPARVSKSSRSTVTAKTFCARLSKNFQPLAFPNFGDTSDKDSKAKAHLRAQIKAVFNSKDMDVYSSDIRKWSESDLCEISNLFSKMLSVQDHLVDFVSGVIKSYWNTAKSKVQHK